MASISLKNVKKVYPGNVTAVHEFSLDIADKEFIVLVGPSGCGKSTTLRMIAGLEEITSGDLYIGENRVNDVAPKNRDIAMVFQNYALYPHMSVYKNMAFALELRQTPKDEIDRRVKEAAEMLELTPYLDRKPKALSGGQRQRVALGRAMVRDPAAFLLDEPLSNLDAKLRAAMRIEIARLHKRLGTTFVYVTHDQVEAMTMGDRIVVMKDGYIQQVDTPQALYDKPCNLFVAGFIGSPQMNFLTAAVTENGLQTGEDILPLNSEKAAALKSYIGKEVTIGIRPEHIHEASSHEGQACAAKIEAAVEITEMMGSEVYVYAKYGEERLVIKLPYYSKSSNDQISLAINTDMIHVFDRDTSETITN